MKATLKKINAHLVTLTEYGDDIELIKGNGYFYFGVKPDSCLLRNEYPYWAGPVSIHVCHLNHMSLEDWNKHVEWRIEDWKPDPVCLRCGVVLDTAEGFQTGICANCWKPETDEEVEFVDGEWKIGEWEKHDEN